MDERTYQEVPDGNGGATVVTNMPWKPLYRQVLVCIGVWTMYFMPGLFMGLPPIYIAQKRREANSTEAVTVEMASWLSSSISYGAIPWVFILPAVAHRFGRKAVFKVLSVNAVVSYSLLYFSQSTMQVMFSEIMAAMTVASHTTVAVMIIAEYTSPQYRGIFLTLKSAIMYWGIWVGNAVGTFSHWRNIGVLGLFSCVFCGTVIFWPESPYWLASKGKFDKCVTSYRWLRGVDRESEHELEMLIKSRKDLVSKRSPRQNTVKKFIEVIQRKEVYRPLITSFPLLALYDFSGKIVCTMYILDIVKEVTENESAAYLVMLLLDGVTVLGMYLGCGISKLFKRKTILLGFTSVGITFLYIISLYLYLIKQNVINKNNILLTMLLTGYSMFISIGPMLMITTIYGEIIPLKFSHEASIFGGLFDALFSTVMIKCAPSIFKALGLHGSFLFYSVASTILTIILYKYLPETKDKTLQEISEWFGAEVVKPTDGESKHFILEAKIS